MNDNTDISAHLSNAADSVDVGTADATLTEVRAKAGTRRRRRNAIAGVAAAGALVASGAVVANVTGGSSDDDRLISSAETEEAEEALESEATEDETTEAPETTALPVPDATAPAGNGAIPVQVVPATGTVVDESSAANEFGNSKVLPWQGGFLSVSQNYSPQLLPTELPEEITAQFPQEVLDLFPDGLPPTIDEATQILQDAGLFDVVSEIVLSNSEVSDAIYSAPPAAPEVDSRFSADGVEWADIDLRLPEVPFDMWTMTSTGDRLAFVSNSAMYGPGGANAEAGSIDVYSTTDLATWTSQPVITIDAPVDLPDFIRVETYPSQLVANADRWMVSVSTYSNVDVSSLVTEEMLAEFGENYGYGTSPEGIEIYNGEDGEGYSQISWEELGVELPDDVFGPGESQIISSDWNGTPVTSDLGVEGEFYGGNVIALDDAFAFSNYSGTVSVSSDGVAWTDYAMPDGAFGGSLMAVGDTLVTFSDGDASGTTPYLLDRTAGTWNELDIAGLPERYHSGSVADGAAVLMELDEEMYNDAPFVPSFVATTMSAEVEGYRLELNVSFGGQGDGEGENSVVYTLTDIESGEVVLTETLDPEDFDGDFEFIEEVYDIDGQEGIRVFDPETGEELLAIPFADMVEQAFDADGNEVDLDFSITEGEEFDSEMDYIEPTPWLVATDGTNWIVQDLSGPDADLGVDGFVSSVGVNSLAVSNGVVVVANYDGTLTRFVIG